MRTLLKYCDKWSTALEEACINVVNSCQACVGSDTRCNRSQISLNQVNEAFNNNIHADLLVATIPERKYYVNNIICNATNYGISMIVDDTSVKTMRNILEKYWIYFFGSPIQFSVDPEFTRGIMQIFLLLHNIELCQRPARASNKNGKVERQNGVFKTILEHLERHEKEADPDNLIAKPSFLTNISHSSKTISSFQMAM